MNSCEPKIIFILIDGIGDIQVKQLDNKSPLQYSNLPTIDLIAKTGITGLMDPVEVGLACGSDTAHMNIFGYNPFQEYRGRGSFEVQFKIIISKINNKGHGFRHPNGAE